MFKRLRSFHRGTLDLCGSKGCKVISCQSWRFEKNSVSQPEWNHLVGAWVRVLDDWIILKVWWTITLQPFDVQRLAVRSKDLNLLCWHIVWTKVLQHFCIHVNLNEIFWKLYNQNCHTPYAYTSLKKAFFSTVVLVGARRINPHKVEGVLRHFRPLNNCRHGQKLHSP